MKNLTIFYSGNAALDLALDTIKIKKQAFIFTNTKSSAERTAEDIANKLDKISKTPALPPPQTSQKKLEELADKIEHVLSRPTRQCQRLAKCVRKGIAFHHAGLTNEQKSLIEDAFRRGLIKIICCTPTLAAGVDFPAFRVILKDLRRFSIRGMQWIPVLEYLQMAGRAGRPTFDSFGEAITIAKTKEEKNKIEERYLKGEAEEIYSKLAVEPVLRVYLLSLIATEFTNTRKDILDFFSKTFWAYQFKDMGKLEWIIEKILGLLEEWEFIKVVGEKPTSHGASHKCSAFNVAPPTTKEFVSAEELSKNVGDDHKIEATLLGKRIAELYIDPLTAHHIISCLRRKMKEMSAFALLQMISNTLEMRPLLRVRLKEYDEIQAEATEHELLGNEPSMWDPDYEDWLSSVKTALFFNDWVNEADEEALLERYNTRPGETRVKLGIANWLLYASSELSRILAFKTILKDILKLRLRLKYGVKEELLALLKLEGIGRVRARKLFNNGIKTIGDVKRVDILKLIQLIGRKTALDIKKQVGQEIKEVPKGKRKGQLGLGKYQK